MSNCVLESGKTWKELSSFWNHWIINVPVQQLVGSSMNTSLVTVPNSTHKGNFVLNFTFRFTLITEQNKNNRLCESCLQGWTH